MTALLAPDPLAGAAYRNMVAHLAGPLTAGAQDTELALDTTGAASVSWAARYPLLVAALRGAADADAVTVMATPPGATVTFAPYTEAGAFLPLLVPAVDANGRAEPFGVTLASPGVAADALAGLVELRLLEGVLGRLLYVLASEKARLRAQGRTLAAMRRLDRAYGDALDRHGADLGVPRFIDGTAQLEREPDDDYRRRLAPYRPWLRASPARVGELLNGPGADGDPNAGPLGELGLSARFALVEADNPFAVALQLVVAGDAGPRANLLAFARAVHLIWPLDDAGSNATHAARLESPARALEVAQLRADLRAGFAFAGQAANEPALAPALASALALVGRVRAALGLGQWQLTRAQDDGGGSRYELGLGADVVPLSAAELASAAAALPGATSEDPELQALLAELAPRPSVDDPDGAWMLEPCGLRTAFRVDSSTLFVSHLPMFGLTIAGPGIVSAQGIAQVVPGFFGRRGPSGDLLLYDRFAGETRLLGRDPKTGAPEDIATSDWATTVGLIAPGRFTTGRATTDVVIYEPATGKITFAGLDGTQLVPLGTSTSSTSWSAIVPIQQRRALTALFCYDRGQGAAQFFTTDGQGGLAPLGRPLSGLRRGWTHVVAGALGGSGPADLLFFDGETGDAQLCTTDGYGTLNPLSDLSWDPRWTHVVLGRFLAQDGDAVLLYDAADGGFELHGPGLERVAGGTLPSGWTHVVAADFGDPAARLFGYDRVLGAAAWYASAGAGSFTLDLRVDGWSRASGSEFTTTWASEADPGSNAALADGLARADTAWTAAGYPAWTVVAGQAWAPAVVPPAAPAEVFAAAGLASPADPAPVVAQLNELPGELLATLELPPGLAGPIRSGDPGAPAQLRALVAILRDAGLSAALPLVTASDVLLVVGVVGLPGVGLNLGERAAAGFRWYVVPIASPGGVVQGAGARTQFVPAGEGLSAVVVVGYARAGLTDPYEYRADLPAGTLLTRTQYEFVMNLLELATPAGVRVNTFALRSAHVDLDGDGAADKLDATLSRTYRRFRRRRHAGATALPDQP